MFALGSMKMEAIAKPMKTRAPMKVMTLADMNLATIIPTRTAAPVQTVCPAQPPSMTPHTLLRPARTMVASWDLSPHSAMKVMVKHLMKTLKSLRQSVPHQGLFSQ